MNNFSLTALVRPESMITIMDIGASFLEDPPYANLTKMGLARIIGFEPNAVECEKLKDIYGYPHEFYPYFIGDGNPATFYETTWFVTGSLYKPNKVLLEKYQGLYEVTTPIAEHQVQTKAIDDISGLSDIDYIKIDVQGGELSAFKGGQSSLDKVLVIHTEVEFAEFYENQPLFADVDQYLRSRGFSFVKFVYCRGVALKPCFINGDINIGNQQMWADAIYMRNWITTENINKLSDDQLIKAAIIAHDVYNMTDFSHYFLSHLDSRTGSIYSNRYLEMFAK